MGKHVEVKRVAFNTLIAAETLEWVRAEADRLGISQGALIDRAVRVYKTQAAQEEVCEQIAVATAVTPQRTFRPPLLKPGEMGQKGLR